jgi:uncharacterized protein
MASSTAFFEAVSSRRSMYTLDKNPPISKEKIQEIVTFALKHAPSPFNVRSTRVVLLFGEEHEKLWQEAYAVTEKQSPAAIEILGSKIKGFEAAFGTVSLLF